jgi:hypothetical protein
VAAVHALASGEKRGGAGSPEFLFQVLHDPQGFAFFEALRRRELEILDAWCRADHAASVRLLIGPDGTGKTGLLIHGSSKHRSTIPAILIPARPIPGSFRLGFRLAQ